MIHYPGMSPARSNAEYLYADRLGSIVASFTRSGWVRAINSYDEFGVPGAASGTANTGRFRYTGQIYIPALGQYHYKARAYSPTLGRFMQTDPIGYGDGLNMYAYVGNDPVNSVDPLGLCRTIYNDSWIVDYYVAGKWRERHRERGPVHTTYTICGGEPGAGSTGLGGGEGGGAAGLGGVSGNEIVVQRNKRQSVGRRIYRWIVPDPCAGRGTNEGTDILAGYEPYDVNEGASLAVLYGHVLPEHGLGTRSGRSEFSSKYSNSEFLLGVISLTILTNPAPASGNKLAYTVNTGGYVGYDAVNGGETDYITVIMSELIDGERTLVTAHPGCR